MDHSQQQEEGDSDGDGCQQQLDNEQQTRVHGDRPSGAEKKAPPKHPAARLSSGLVCTSVADEARENLARSAGKTPGRDDRCYSTTSP